MTFIIFAIAFLLWSALIYVPLWMSSKATTDMWFGLSIVWAAGSFWLSIVAHGA